MTVLAALFLRAQRKVETAQYLRAHCRRSCCESNDAEGLQTQELRRRAAPQMMPTLAERRIVAEMDLQRRIVQLKYKGIVREVQGEGWRVAHKELRVYTLTPISDCLMSDCLRAVDD